MENLPIEVVEKIAKHLTRQELAVCCAVSRPWRDIFGHDWLWKPWCDETLAEHLRTLECRVEPRFVSPETEDSSLTTIQEWRLSFMRENHLWNNWRQGKFKQEPLDSNSNYRCGKMWSGICSVFVKEDYLLRPVGSSVELWGVKQSPVCFGQPLTVFDQTPVDFCKTFGNDDIVIVQGTCVQVYQVTKERGSESRLINTDQWPLLYRFFFDKGEEEAFFDAEITKRRRKDSQDVKCMIVRDLFIGVCTNIPVIHIWNLVTRRKLQRAECPEQGETRTLIRLSASDKVAMVVGIAVEKFDKYYHKTHEFVIINFMYSLNQLDFLPFKIVYNPFGLSIEKEFHATVIQDGIVALTCSSTVEIYNYHTSDLLAKLDYVNGNPFLVHSQKVCVPLLNYPGRKEGAVAFNTRGKNLEHLSWENADSKNIRVVSVLCNRFLIVKDCDSNACKPTYWAAEAKTKTYGSTSLNILQFPTIGQIGYHFSVNESCTKIFSEECDGKPICNHLSSLGRFHSSEVRPSILYLW